MHNLARFRMLAALAQSPLFAVALILPITPEVQSYLAAFESEAGQRLHY